MSLTFSLNAFAIGLGDMTVLSSLDQPFDAEIRLIDVGDIPLSGIKANLAEVEEYERAGLERSFELNTLTFVIEHNRRGQAVIHLRSIERISNPFIQLLVDLAWPKGQIYRAYDVLLDPPDYQLATKKEIQTHQIKHKKHKLAPEKPLTNGDMSPASVAPEIQLEVTIESHIPSAPVFTSPVQFSKQYLSAGQNSSMSTESNVSHLEGISTALKAQMDVTVQAIDSLRESNALLKEQLHSMHDQNQVLHKQLKQRDTEMKHMRAQIELLMRRQGLAGQVIQQSDDMQESSWLLWLFILLAVGAGGTYVAWKKWGVPDVEKAYQFVRSRMKPKVNDKQDETESAIYVETKVVSEAAEPITGVKENAQKPSVESTVTHDVNVKEVKTEVVEPVVEPEVVAKEELVSAVEPVVAHAVVVKQETPEVALDFSDCTETDLQNQVDVTSNGAKQSTEEDVSTPHVIEFVSEAAPEEESLKPVKSESALETLLTLTQTYIEMGDTDAARESLKEVLEFGNKKQQTAAKKLMKALDSK